jgi:hypothetical protein
MRGAGRANQDAVIVSDRAVAVLDGATSWLPQAPDRDGGWYARHLAALLLPTLDIDRPLADLLADAIGQLATTYDLTDDKGPESTVTIARWNTDSLELLVLGDSPGVVELVDEPPTYLLDDRLQPVGAQARAAYREHLRSGHGYGPDLDELLAQLQRDELAGRNTPGGYWIAAGNPTAAHQCLTRSWPLTTVRSVTLLSDGAAAGVDEYSQPADWTQALADLHRHGPAKFIAEVHATENSDPDGHRWPRAKRHDDKTLAIATRQ